MNTVRKSLTEDAAITMVHAFVTSRVDYCNSVLHRVSAATNVSFYRTYSTPLLESYCVSGSSTTSPLTFEIDYIGCTFNSV